MMKKFKAHPLLVGTIPAFIFGFSFMFTKIGLKGFDSVYHLIALRFLFAAGSLWILKLLKVIKIDLKGRNITPILVLSVFQPVGYFTFETIGIKLTSSSQTGIMIAFIPVAVAVLAGIVIKEKTTLKQWGFISLSIAGVLLVNINNLTISGNAIGMIVLLVTVFVGSLYQVLARKHSNLFSPMEITYIMMWFGAIAFNIIAVIEKLIKGDISSYLTPLGDKVTLVALLYLGILSSVVAFLVLNYVLSKIEATKASILANLTTIVSIFAGVLIMKESFELVQYAGGIMILAGVWGTSKGSSKK